MFRNVRAIQVLKLRALESAWHPAEISWCGSRSFRIDTRNLNFPAFKVSEVSAFIRTDGRTERRIYGQTDMD